MKKVVVNGRPHSCLFAVKDILPGEQVVFNYGDSEEHLFWRRKRTHSRGRGRMANYHRHGNSKMKKVVVNGRPHLCLFAVKDILPGEQVVFNYGDSEEHLFWRRKVAYFFSNFSLIRISLLMSRLNTRNTCRHFYTCSEFCRNSHVVLCCTL